MIDKTYDIARASKLKDNVRSSLDALFLAYGTLEPSSGQNSSDEQNLNSNISSDVDVSKYVNSLFDMQIMDHMDGLSKSELDKYLSENREISSPCFDILTWWKLNALRYPKLALIARDVLAIPVSTVAFESAFSTGGRVVDSFRSALTPRIVDTLVCAQNWLRCSTQPIHLDNIMEQI
ncbi:Zinc finger BED domain-containing protein RICESLEEPER 4 [Euphorbia peplus]|nr:Zinc finger BED domain-containing protein RICESLEEPER 4 [Euphorbia peplus]